MIDELAKNNHNLCDHEKWTFAKKRGNSEGEKFVDDDLYDDFNQHKYDDDTIPTMSVKYVIPKIIAIIDFYGKFGEVLI